MSSTVLSESTQAQLDEYLARMLEANESINLTRVTDNEQARLLHTEDSLAVLPEFKDAPEGPYGDMGSGCGFPGVALSIATGRKAVLIDSVKKKMHAVDQIITEMGLSHQIETNGSRIEELAIEKPNSFAVLTARALSSLPSLLELASPLLEPNGWLIALKSHVQPEELQRAQSIQKETGMKLVRTRDYYLSDAETFRSVYVFSKNSNPTVKLPRRVGLAQKKPLA